MKPVKNDTSIHFGILEILIAFPNFFLLVLPSTPFQTIIPMYQQLFYKTPLPVVLSVVQWFYFHYSNNNDDDDDDNVAHFKYQGIKWGREKKEHDDCKENQIAKLGILVVFFTVCCKIFESIHVPIYCCMHADAYFSGVQCWYNSCRCWFFVSMYVLPH